MARRRRPALLAVAAVLTLTAGTATYRLAAGGEPDELTLTVLDGEPAGPGDRALVFSEDFDEPLDPDIWNRCHWWEPVGCTIASNDEEQLYLPDNVAVADDVGTLTARRGPVRNDDGTVFPYASGMISTGPPGNDLPANLAFTYGYVEARLRLPAGRGLWPAFWLLPVDEGSRPEIDVVETLGHTPERARFHFHGTGRDGDDLDVGHDWVDEDLADGDWHDYAVDWRPGSITWIVDGRARWRIAGPAVPDEPLHLVLNLAVGGDWPGSPDASTRFPAAVEAEWIRVWQDPASS